jgi:hypothetical protein
MLRWRIQNCLFLRNFMNTADLENRVIVVVDALSRVPVIAREPGKKDTDYLGALLKETAAEVNVPVQAFANMPYRVGKDLVFISDEIGSGPRFTSAVWQPSREAPAPWSENIICTTGCYRGTLAGLLDSSAQKHPERSKPRRDYVAFKGNSVLIFSVPENIRDVADVARDRILRRQSTPVVALRA